MTVRAADVTALVRHFTAGERVFVPGSAGEAPGLLAAICAEAPPLDLTVSFVPGINLLPLDALPAGSIARSMFAQPASKGAQAEGRFRQSPASYGAFAKQLATGRFDTLVVHVAPPDGHGQCSLGVAVEFTPLVRARRIMAVMNPNMPRLAGATALPFASFDLVCESDGALREYDVGESSAQARVIAGHIADFVGDGAALQIGLGKVPDALLALLADRRGLRLSSGMLSDGARLLTEAGSLDPDFAPISCVHVGSLGYYAWLADQPAFRVCGCDVSHDPVRLAQLAGLVAVNSAVSVDLFGQANLEMLDGRSISGVGGAADFARAASLAPGGISIVALPATNGRGDISRVVPQLGLVSLPRQDIDVVITEHGAADLRGLCVSERGERLITIAAPSHRDALAAAWRDIAQRL